MLSIYSKCKEKVSTDVEIVTLTEWQTIVFALRNVIFLKKDLIYDEFYK